MIYADASVEKKLNCFVRYFTTGRSEVVDLSYSSMRPLPVVLIQVHCTVSGFSKFSSVICIIPSNYSYHLLILNGSWRNVLFLAPCTPKV